MMCAFTNLIQNSKNLILLFSCANVLIYLLTRLSKKKDSLPKKGKDLTTTELVQITDKVKNCCLILMAVWNNLERQKNLFPKYRKEFSRLLKAATEETEKILLIPGNRKHRNLIENVNKKISILSQSASKHNNQIAKNGSNHNDQLTKKEIEELWSEVLNGLETQILRKETFVGKLFFTMIMPHVKIVVAKRIDKIAEMLKKISHQISLQSPANGKTFLSTRVRQLRNQSMNIKILKGNINEIMILMDEKFPFTNNLNLDIAQIKEKDSNYFVYIKDVLKYFQNHISSILEILEMPRFKYRPQKKVVQNPNFSCMPLCHPYSFFWTYQFPQDPNGPNLNFPNLFI